MITMRTVNPEKWSKTMQKPSMHLTRPMRFGQQPSSSRGLEMRIRSSFRDAMKEYWLNCTVKGVKCISDRSLSNFERYWHAGVLTVALGVGISVLTYSCYQLGTAPPVQVNLQSSQHSIQQIPFPAVALCSTNVISRGPLMDYTLFLDSRDQNNTYQSWSIRRNLLMFGALLTMNLPEVDVMFMTFLSRADPKFNVSRLMYQFSSSCDSMLRRCSWRGVVTPCRRLFATRATPLGYCCVFNSRYYSEDIHRPLKYLDKVGQDNGLSVVVQENTDEFAYIRRANIGLEVLLFDGSEYPLLEGGGVRLYPAERNASVFMSLSASAQYSADAGLPGCRSRAAVGPRAARSYAWCLAQCRRRTLAALCGCRLHTLTPDPTDNNPVCSLSHLACLNKHREKLIYYYPTGTDSDPALNEEIQNGQVCSECSSDCTRLVYSASIATSRYSSTSTDRIFKNIFTKDESLVNSTVIRLFYTSEHQKLYTIEANQKWFESFATISSAWSCIVGSTMIAASEVTFFFTIRWMHHYRRRALMVTYYKTKL